MMTDKAPENSNPVETKDYWSILALIAMEHVPVKIEQTEEGERSVMVYHFPSTAHTHYEAWMRGEREGPLGVIRRVKSAAELFKDNLHRYARR